MSQRERETPVLVMLRGLSVLKQDQEKHILLSGPFGNNDINRELGIIKATYKKGHFPAQKHIPSVSQSSQQDSIVS